MAGEWYSLTQSQIMRKVYTNKGLSDLLEEVFSRLPVKRGPNFSKQMVILGDRDWSINSGKPFMIKVDWRNYAYITKGSLSPINEKTGWGTFNGDKKQYTILYPNSSGKKPIKITFRLSSKVQVSKGGTPEQERGSAWIFKRVLARNTLWKDFDDFVGDKDTYPQLMKIFRGNVPEDWLISYLAQSNAFFKRWQGHTFEEFDRDSPQGFAQYLNNEVIKKYKGLLGGKKDNWNPADIWITKGSTANLKTELKNQLDGEATIQELNIWLRQKFHDDEVIGVSLKKTGAKATWEEINVDGLLLDTRDYNFPVGNPPSKPASAMTAKFDIAAGKKMFTQDVWLQVTSPQRDRTYKFQLKANSSEQPNQNLKFEAQMSGAASARLGKAPVDMIVGELHKMKSYKNGGGKGFVNDKNNKMFPNNNKQYIENQAEWEKKIQFLIGQGLNTDMKDITKISQNIVTSFGAGKIEASNTKCKLMAIQFCYSILQMSEADLWDFVTRMVFLSQKEAYKYMDHFGPFGKIY